MRKGKEVTVSGWVSSDPIKNPLQIGLYVSNDEGKTYRTYAMVRNYCGKGGAVRGEVHGVGKGRVVEGGGY